jgi:isopentenyl-diphosphate Delta-isomerase
MTASVNEVILVNERDEPTGTMEKMEAHRKGLLHRAFSVFVFNSRGEMLLQQRAEKKYHSGGLWTNACCSHPLPGEHTPDAANRRLREEMGFATKLDEVFDFVYRHRFENGLIEHEYDHVFTGFYEGMIAPDADEVQDYCYLPMPKIEESLRRNPEKFTAWFLLAFERISEWHKQHFEDSVKPKRFHV